MNNLGLQKLLNKMAKNKTKKAMEKINEKIFALAVAVEELGNYEPTTEYDIRDHHIVSNIKVYDWLDEDDRDKIIEIFQLTDAEKEQVIKEFDENRLSGIYNHHCQDEVEYFKEWVEGCAHTN